MEIAIDECSSIGLGVMSTAPPSMASSASIPIDSSNIGFRLLKKQGWKEGTGLGVSQQGRLEPIEAFIKKNKRGLGADKPKKSTDQPKPHDGEDAKVTLIDINHFQVAKSKPKRRSKKMRKIEEFEKRLQEQEFDRNFFREFWPDNV
ncbi:hypothetical protein MIMGU_mgv1a019067mg [Erythranthe guttata]|uniref:G-patch domain-containing protein n=1 Tax=Erythranthe guttata TaxID=4155 RepID=A0A022QSH0_ERYGU|nr:hypothetical protein MIMGU_mgv1a019067mg [Erythranthe guttata]